MIDYTPPLPLDRPAVTLDTEILATAVDKAVTDFEKTTQASKTRLDTASSQATTLETKTTQLQATLQRLSLIASKGL